MNEQARQTERLSGRERERERLLDRQTHWKRDKRTRRQRGSGRETKTERTVQVSE